MKLCCWWAGVVSFAASPSSSFSWTNTAQLLQALDRRGIRYPPTATRGELEALWQTMCWNDQKTSSSAAASSLDQQQQQQQQQESQPQRPPDRPDTFAADSTTITADIAERQHRRRRRHRRLEQEIATAAAARSRSPFSSVAQHIIPAVDVTSLKSTAGDLLNQGYRKVRRVKRDLVDAWMETDDGVRTVPYEYVARFDDVWNRQKKSSHEDSYSGRGRTRRRPSSDAPPAQVVDEEDDAFRSRPPPQQPTPKRAKQRRSYQYQQSRPMLLLPPAGRTAASGYTTANRHAPRHSSFETPQRPKRKVYNPYGDQPTSYNTNPATGDLLDEIGNFFVKAADRTLWNDNVVASFNNNDKQQRGPSKNNTERKKKKHWKDVWEERVDSMLGIHDDDQGEDSYRKWTDGPPPPEPIVPPFLRPRPRRRNRRQSGSLDEPYWGRGSILSLILNRHEPPVYAWDRVDALWESSSSVLTLLRWCARTVARWYGKVCRWAAYDQTLPQAPVVCFVTAITLSVSKRRLLAAAIALVTTRAIGEAVRGEATTAAWENDDNQEEEEEKESPEEDNSPEETSSNSYRR